MFILWVMGLLANIGMLAILKSNRGEAGAEDSTKAAEAAIALAEKAGIKLLPQSQVDAVVQERLARERSKYFDYDDLKKFKTEHEQNAAAATEKDLLARKEYDKAKETWNIEQQRLTGLVTEKDKALTDMRIGTALMGEINKQNAYAEETMALIKSQAVFDEQGNLRIQGIDKNGTKVLHSVEEGIKNFLTQRPHLVKAQQRAGGGTPPGNTGGAGAGVQDLNALNGELQAAMNRGDRKAVGEIKTKISVLRGVAKTTL